MAVLQTEGFGVRIKREPEINLAGPLSFFEDDSQETTKSSKATSKAAGIGVGGVSGIVTPGHGASGNLFSSFGAITKPPSGIDLGKGSQYNGTPTVGLGHPATKPPSIYEQGPQTEDYDTAEGGGIGGGLLGLKTSKQPIGGMNEGQAQPGVEGLMDSFGSATTSSSLKKKGILFNTAAGSATGTTGSQPNGSSFNTVTGALTHLGSGHPTSTSKNLNDDSSDESDFDEPLPGIHATGTSKKSVWDTVANPSTETSTVDAFKHAPPKL
ncbi:unnamed protein product [Bursaphelenchus xylophilus]|uniref:(pine wood nematode) hypothetical protein n=1 Tax=Bursaphelenchus xylophilus TaxID=6326 RepID=A0A1I7RPA8_BURXY|nr:unnamed protein product [Bursaphelenchus xylophilus]CAG9095702.1 unnamed protein product [Bursaphelenchus xylophilus]